VLDDRSSSTQGSQPSGLVPPAIMRLHMIVLVLLPMAG
jgi:hypothetical protein